MQKEKPYQQKNKFFDTGENKFADNALCMMEASTVLSETFRNQIKHTVYWIVANHEGHEESIRKRINDIRDEMEWLTIFNESFISKLCFRLEQTLGNQIYLDNLAKNTEKK
jgi:hypothetical protein